MINVSNIVLKENVSLKQKQGEKGATLAKARWGMVVG